MDGFSGVAEADEYARLLGLGATAGRMVRHVANVDAAAPRRSLAPGEPPVQQGGFCVICMDSFDEVLRRDAITDRGIRETLCGHTFCSPCIEKWLADSVSCPVCMRDLSPEGGLAIRDEPGTAAPTPDRAASEYRASSTLGSGAYDRGNGGGWRGGAGTSPSHAFGAMHTPVIVDFGTGAGPQLASAEELAGVLRARRHRLEFLTALGSGLFDDDRGSDARRSDGREDRERTGDVGRALRFLSHEGNRRRAAERQQRVSPELGGYRVYEAGGGLPAEAARGPCPHARPEGGTSPLSDRGDPLHVARAVYHFDQVARMFDTLAASAEAVRRL